jgi:hypothetical protein
MLACYVLRMLVLCFACSLMGAWRGAHAFQHSMLAEYDYGTSLINNTFIIACLLV